MSTPQFKYILIGDSGVGKSSLLLQFTEREFRHEHDVTIGVEFASRGVLVGPENKEVKLEMWDTAGQEAYLALTRQYYRNTDGCIMVYDITNRESFEHLPRWLSEVRKSANNPNLVLMLMGNKTDLEHQRQISTEEATKFAEANGILSFMEGSATAYHEVEEAFMSTANAIYEVTGANEENLKNGTPASELLRARLDQQRSGCC